MEHFLDLFNPKTLIQYGGLTFLLIIIFAETGLFLGFFLPGDSLLFACGTIAAATNNTLNVQWLFLLLCIASIAGNSVNYLIGRWLGTKVFQQEKSWFFNKQHLIRAHNFYQRYGGKTLIIARFIPIIRTFAPFVAGIGQMNYRYFTFYNVIGGILWIGALLYTGYFFGNIPLVKNNFSTVILLIIIVSLLPAIVGLIKTKSQKKWTN